MVRTMPELSDASALVTGASRGIGRGIAEGLCAEGATVAINHPPVDRETENAQAVVDAVEAAGGDAFAVRADVTEEADVRRMIDDVEARVGALDILVNNAGGGPPTSPVGEMDVDVWDQVLDLNLRGVFLTTRFALPSMVDAGAGKIINISSQQGILGAAERAHYSAAKGGVISFTRALARELAPDITVNAVAPGPIATGKRDDPDAFRARAGPSVPLGRVGEVGDVVPTVLLLAGSGGDYYTGQTLSPDGGDAMH